LYQKYLFFQRFAAQIIAADRKNSRSSSKLLVVTATLTVLLNCRRFNAFSSVISVVETAGMVIPAAIGSDINCGMQLHIADLSIEQFLAKCFHFVELIKGDYFFGTRDVSMTAKTARAMFQHGIPGWLDAMLDKVTGSVVNSKFQQLAKESDRTFLGGSMNAMSNRLYTWGVRSGQIAVFAIGFSRCW
jgi:tRNA-splicing ligase RtcB